MELFDVHIVKTLLIVVAIGLWLNWLWTRRHLYRFMYNFPGPLCLPLIGILYRLKHPKDILTLITKIYDEWRIDTGYAWIGMDPWFVTRDPEVAKNILSSPELLNKVDVYNSFNEFSKGGLLTSPVDEWQHHRKLINPSFNHKVLVNYLPIFHKAKVLTLSKFDALVGKGENKLEDMLQKIVIRLSVETTMGKELKENDEVDENIPRKLQFFKKAAMLHVVLATLRLQGLFYFYTQFYKSVKYIQDYVEEILKKKLEKLNESEQNSNQNGTPMVKGAENEEFSIKKKPTIFIENAIQFYRNQQFTWNNIFSESVTIVAAAFDTTSIGVFSSLVMLAMHPDVQEKLYEEIVSIFPDKDFVMEFEDMEKLTYLDMVIKETLRITPPGPLIGRQVVKDTQLTKDILLPKGMNLMISIYHLHRNTNVWGPDADKFNPDNFLPHNIEEKHSHAFIPFSKGARNCIGWRYAMFAMKVILAGCVRNFKFTTKFKYEDLKFFESIVIEYEIESEIEIHRRE